MAQITHTRKELRRAVCLELGMPFYRKYKDGESAIDSNSTTTRIVDTALNQRNTFWNGHWFFGLVADDVSVIRGFSSSEKSFILEVPMATTPTAGDKFEILSKWSPVEVHDAINTAINLGTRSFPKRVEDTSLVVCKDTMSYSLSNLTDSVWKLNKVEVERAATIFRGTTASATNNTLVIGEAASHISSVTDEYIISIYAGTGKGQVRNISNVSSQTITVTSVWDTNPDSTSLWTIRNPNDERYDWVRLDIFYTDRKEYPSTLRLRTVLTQYYGMRLRLSYLSTEEALEADSDTTVVPKEFLKYRACALLHGKRIGNTKADRDMHYAESERYEKRADAYYLGNIPRGEERTIPISDGMSYMDTENPMDW